MPRSESFSAPLFSRNLPSDLDPGGDNIAQNFLHYMIRDAGLDEEQVQAWKIALTMVQVRSLGLPRSRG